LIASVKVLPAQFLNLSQDFAAQPSRRQPNRCHDELTSAPTSFCAYS
jgi:hypothetical protein